MNVVTRGIRNAFRNTIRTVSIVIILGLSIALALAMLIARQAVSDKITSIKSSVGNTISVAPAGYNPMSDANNALTTSDLKDVKALNHVSKVVETLTGRLSTEGSASMAGPGGQTDSNATTSLKSAIDLNSVNKSDDGPRIMINGSSSLPSNFSLPIRIVGTTDASQNEGNALTIKSGKAIDGTKDVDEAMISTSMASKNGLEVGSTFTAYGKTLTVAGIFDSGTKAGNDTVVVSLATLQRLSDQSDVVSSATISVDSADNLNSVTSAVKEKLGDSADVTNAADEAENTVKPLENIQTISLYSLIGSVIAGSVIILLTMIMIVRERRREIGVAKAIGAPNTKIMLQFMTEAITLTVLGAVIGIALGVVAGSPITKMLVTNSTSSATDTMQQGGRMMMGGGGAFRSISKSATNVTTSVGWDIILYGLGAAIIIAVVGSAIASYFIAKVRPAEVMRAE